MHTPVEARESSQALFDSVPSRGKVDTAGIAAMTNDVDESIGLLRAKIAALGIAENTYLVVMSDNGGSAGGSRGSDVSALKGGKGSLYEGGIRIPFFVEGPGIEAGSVSNQSIMGCDLYPTFCEWAGIETPEGLEGVSLAAVLSASAQQLAESSILFSLPPHTMGKASARSRNPH